MHSDWDTLWKEASCKVVGAPERVSCDTGGSQQVIKLWSTLFTSGVLLHCCLQELPVDRC